MLFDRFLLPVESCDLSQTRRVVIIGFLGQSEFFGKHSGPNFLQNKFSQSSLIYLSPEKLRQTFTFLILQNFNF